MATVVCIVGDERRSKGNKNAPVSRWKTGSRRQPTRRDARVLERSPNARLRRLRHGQFRAHRNSETIFQHSHYGTNTAIHDADITQDIQVASQRLSGCSNGCSCCVRSFHAPQSYQLTPLASVLPQPIHVSDIPDDEDQVSLAIPSQSVAVRTAVPPYGRRKGWKPTSPEDFGTSHLPLANPYHLLKCHR